jgi:hypothetical protein
MKDLTKLFLVTVTLFALVLTACGQPNPQDQLGCKLGGQTVACGSTCTMANGSNGFVNLNGQCSQ